MFCWGADGQQMVAGCSHGVEVCGAGWHAGPPKASARGLSCLALAQGAARWPTMLFS